MDSTIRRMMGLPYEGLYSYWQHYWRHSVEKLADKDNVSFRIFGPRLVIRDLIEEIDGHGLVNRDNVCYFAQQLSNFDKNDKVFNSLCHPIAVCLIRRLNDKNNKETCSLLCKKIQETMVKQRYFEHLVDWLAEAIGLASNNNYENRKIINDITGLIIAEFTAEGFMLDEIKNYSTYVPDVAIAEGGSVISAPEEFDGLKESDFTSKEEYFGAVSEKIKNWDIYRRLEVLKYHYTIKPREAYFIVRLNGLKGLIDDKIGDINIYSPKVKRYITSEQSFSEIEKVVEGRDSVNAAIPIEFFSIEQAKVHAIAKLEEVLDILMLTYRTKTPITMATNIIAVVAEGRELCMSMSVKGNDPRMASGDEMIRYVEALDLTDVKKEGFLFLSDKHHIIEVGRGDFGRRLKNAAHWFAKAVASNKDEDVLLYSWFAIEGLLKVDSKTQSEMMDGRKNYNSFLVIQKFVTAILCQNYFHSHLRSTYSNFLYLTNQYNNYYDIDEAVINKAALNLKAEDHYRDGDFLKAIPDVIACINDDIVRDELTQLQKFYQDKNGIRDKESQLKNDLLMIYRLRNMIVHNAALSSVNLAFYAREAMYVARHVVWYVIDRASGDKTIEEIILGAKLSYEVFIANYDKELEKLKS